MRFAGKVALVTGGTSGIGLATARRFAAEGAAHVFVTGRRQGALDAAVAAIGGDVTGVRGDLADLDDLDRLAATVCETTGRLDAVVSSAGRVDTGALAEVTPERFDATFDVNARGTFFLVQKLAPLLRDGSAIVLIASVVHRMGVAEYTTYAASKAAMRSFARTWAADLAPRGIRVNSISPGGIDTPAVDAQAADPAAAAARREAMAAENPLGRIGRPEDVASAALFLATAESAFTTGADLPVDGGVTQL